jgi:hypothetical protein
MQDRTLTLSKHEVVLERSFRDDTWELAFGDNAWEKGYSHYDVSEKLKEYSNKALAWDKFYKSIEVPNQSETDKALGAIFINPDDTEENYFLREKLVRILKEVKDE